MSESDARLEAFAAFRVAADIANAAGFGPSVQDAVQPSVEVRTGWHAPFSRAEGATGLTQQGSPILWAKADGASAAQLRVSAESRRSWAIAVIVCLVLSEQEGSRTSSSSAASTRSGSNRALLRASAASTCSACSMAPTVASSLAIWMLNRGGKMW